MLVALRLLSVSSVLLDFMLHYDTLLYTPYVIIKNKL